MECENNHSLCNLTQYQVYDYRTEEKHGQDSGPKFETANF